jgi:ribonucleoside-diphosphate reductase alpha chain
MIEDCVIKRNGQKENISFDKILTRVKKLGGNDLAVNYTSLVQKIIDRIYDEIPTTQIDELTAQQCASLITTHGDYGELASRILISNHHKNTPSTFHEAMSQLYHFRDINDKQHSLISEELWTIVDSDRDALEEIIDYERDYLIDYFGFKTLERAYLMRVNKKIVERPQHMWLRVALGIWGNDFTKVKTTYDGMSQKYFTHATPTLFNAGTPRSQLSSCYLLSMKDDSITGIYETLSDCAKISKWAGGIGLHIHNVRASGSHIRGTNGTSNGIVPMLRVFNNTARYVDQCITPETIIYTTNGPMEIQHCVSGETKIFTTDGCETINNVLEHSYSGEILHINSIHSFKPLSITPEHPVYCLKNQDKGLNYSTIKNRISKKLIKPEWIEARDLTTNDMLIFTKPKYENDDIQLSESDCYMYGLLLGDGSMNNSSTSCYISLHSTNKLDNLNFIKEYLTKKCVKYFINTENNTSRIRWNKSLALPFRYATLYNENKEKYIHAKWLNLPIEKVKYIVKGLIDSDGCIANEIVFDTTSLKLVESLRYLLLRMGIPTGGYIRDRIGEKHETRYGDTIENKKISYCLRIPKTNAIADIFSVEKGQFHKFFEHDNLIYTRISDIKKGTYEGTLYDLQLIKTHNYLIHNGVVHNGGGKRNGSFAIYMEPWHGDIMAFLDMKKNHGDEEQRARDLFYALWIPDEFMRRVQNDDMWTLMCPDQCQGLSDTYGEDFDILYKHYEKEGKGLRQVKARELWFKILDSQMETGTPYMLYKDACNKKSNQKNLGTIKSSNLCVAPETLVLTDKGHIEIQTLANKTVNVWNGKEFSETTIKQTSDNSELITIKFSDGLQLTCTKYHKFYIQTKYSTNMKQDIIKSKNVSIIEAQNLKPDMKLIKCEYPIIDNKKVLKHAYTNGIFSADGTYTNITDKEERKCNFKSLQGKSYCKRHIDYQRNNEISDCCCGISYTKKPHISLYGEKIKLLKYLDYRSIGEEKNNKLNCTLPVDLKDKFFVPSNYSLKSKLDWFAGYCDGDGTISKNGTNQAMQIACIHKDFLVKIKLMLQTCGIASKVTLNMNERYSYLPNGKGGMDYYETKKLWRLLIGSNDLQKLLQLGFSPKRLVVDIRTPQRNAVQFIKISHIEDNSRRDKTFCFTEKKRNAGIFNGVITSQCTEIIEYSNADQTAVCNLASIGLPKFIKKKEPGWNSVKIYAKENCIYCKMATNLLDKNNIKYTKMMVSEEEMVSFKHLFKCTYEIEVKTFPQIIVDEKYLGPYNELVKQLRCEIDYEKLHEITKTITDNLNRVIDVNFYPTEKTRRSNMLHRPIGIGIQGLADTLALMDVPFHSDMAKEINIKIFETIYHASLEKSNEIAQARLADINYIHSKMTNFNIREDINSHKKLSISDLFDTTNSTMLNVDYEAMELVKSTELKRAEIIQHHHHPELGGAYSSFHGSPASKGILQFDMWDVKASDRYDWQHLKNNIVKHGLRNSLLVAPMPTASTSQILGNNECFEPFTSNIYVRRTIAGEFVIVNKHLMRELIALGKWDEDIKNSIIANGGSVQQLDIPKCIKEKYKIVWEIPMKHVLEMAKDRGAFICQSQSTNLWMKDPDYKKLTAMHMFAWKCGLKTGIYYLRTKAKAAPQQFTIEPSKQEDDDCLMCGA